MKPFEDNFENIIDEAVKDIKTVSTTVDSGIKAQEEADKLKKNQAISDFFTAQNCEYFKLPQIFNPSWLNKTYKMKDIEAEIITRIEKTKSDLTMLDRLGEPDAKTFYLSTLNLEAAMAEADKIKANRERLAAIEKVRQEREIAEKMKPETSMPIVEPETVVPKYEHPIVQETISKTETVQLYERSFKVKGTKEQIIALGEYMNANGLVYEKI